MAPSSHAARLRQLFRDRTILTMVELKAALDTQVAMTVFRKLRPLSYLSSYSHRGKYYTLAEIARFDQLGLWSHHGAHFSRHGTLLNTCAVLVGDGEAGYTSDELEHLLQVQVKDPAAQPDPPRTHPAYQGRRALGPLRDRQHGEKRSGARPPRLGVAADRPVVQRRRARSA